MHGSGEEMDVEALQAQIDLSNSVAYDLVSSWMKPNPSSKVSASVSIARELEEHAKRPPRLGLGASISQANTLTAREAAKLKGKLAGTKRARDEGGESSIALAQEDEDDGESRSAAILKKKVKEKGQGGLFLGLAKKDKGKDRDPDEPPPKDGGKKFVASPEESPQQNKRKKHKEGNSSQDGAASNVLETPSKHNPFVMPKIPPTVPSAINLISPSPVQNAVTQETSSPPKKKKKRRHKKSAAEPEAEVDEEWHGFSLDGSEILDSIDEPEHRSPSASQEISTRQHPSKPTMPSTTSSVPDLTSPPPPTPSPLRNSATHSPTQPTKVLNLDGPPMMNAQTGEPNPQSTGESPKRKKPRRRRGKKNRHSNEGGGDTHFSVSRPGS